MRVLAVDHTGGVDVFRERYRVLSTDPDIDLTVFVPETWVEGGRVVRAGRDASGYRILTGKAGFRGYENRGFFYTGVRRALRAARPDVLQLMEEPYSLMALQVALLSKRMCPATRIVFYTFDNLNTGFRYPCRPSWFYGGVQRIVQRVSDCGLVSSGEARRVLESRGFTRPIRHVPFGVDPERFCRREVEKTGSERGIREFVIGFAGRLIPAKGIRVLLEALSFLRMDWSLLVVGGGPEAGAVRARARAEGWENRLVIDDNVTHGEVPDEPHGRPGAPLAYDSHVEGAVRPGADRGDGVRGSRRRVRFGGYSGGDRRCRRRRAGGRCGGARRGP